MREAERRSRRGNEWKGLLCVELCASSRSWRDETKEWVLIVAVTFADSLVRPILIPLNAVLLLSAGLRERRASHST